MAPDVRTARHSCGESNPSDANFCGGCGADLTLLPTCATCQRVASPGARFCQGCGAKLETPEAPADPRADARLAALEEEVASMRAEMEGLLVLKAQLDSAMQRIRQRGGPTAARSPKPTAPRPGAAKSEPAAGEEAESKPAEEAIVTVATTELAPEESAPSVEKPRTIAVIHMEDRPDLQDAVQEAIACFKVATYYDESSLGESIPEGRPLLVANLLAAGNPLSVLTDERLLGRAPRAFTYASDGSRGFVLGLTELFPPPFDPAACATRILSLGQASPRVLVVSGAVLGTPELRAHLVRQGCTTSIAFDERQALNLIPSVRPNLVLIDLNLPRGEGLRLAARLRADEHNNYVRIAFLWQQQIEPDLFRQFAARAAHDYPFRQDELRRQLLQEFNPGGAAHLG